MTGNQAMNVHAYEIMSQPTQYPVADLALAPAPTIAQPGAPNPGAAQNIEGGARRKVLTAQKVVHNGKKYTVRMGPKGGKYILVQKKKHYLGNIGAA